MNALYEELEKRYHDLQNALARSAEQGASSQAAAREFKKIEPMYQKAKTLRQISAEMDKLLPLKSSSDKEMQELAALELETLGTQKARLEQELDDFLHPADPADNRNVIIEIRAGTGGNEAALFAGDLFRMYTRYAAKRGFQAEVYSSHPTGLGGYKEIIFGLQGDGAFRIFKHERGVHRVQRVPVTEASGRIHTSTATVAVLPEVEEIEVEINPADLRIDTYRSSGAGGQHVNRTDSAVRITHLPTGTVVACQDERSQIKNRARAMSILRSKIYEQQREQAESERRDLRRSQVGTGERSEKIRTYNFPQDRITDHRANQNFHNLPAIMDGEMGEIVDAMIAFERARKKAEAGT
ncbi:MAG TPA: peptide chain release factor 1 [Elusimicrobiota bacterium]|nr:peptide chain release factor 1 [Elusimicrobiota bacterium]